MIEVILFILFLLISILFIRFGRTESMTAPITSHTHATTTFAPRRRKRRYGSGHISFNESVDVRTYNKKSGAITGNAREVINDMGIVGTN